jgi:cysteine-rich repeat protein
MVARMIRRRFFSLVGCVAVLLAAVGPASLGSAQAYPLTRTVAAPVFVPQASFYNPVRDELVVIAFEGDSAQIYNSNGDLVRAASLLPTPLGMSVDGAAYDGVAATALVVRHNCEVIELDPVTLGVITRRSLTGSGTVPPPTLCAGIDVGSDGNLYVADYNSARVLVYPRTGTTPLRAFSIAVALPDNLARLPGTNRLMVANNSGGLFAIYDEAGTLLDGPSPIGTGIILGTHTRSNTAGSDGLTFVGTTGRLWFCDHNAPVESCYLHTRGCASDAECPLPFIGCNAREGTCISPVCGDGRVQGGEECDDGNTRSGDGCAAGCVVEPGFVCSGSPSVCGTCMDSSPTGTDTGCTDSAPHCRLSGPRAPQCEVCLDTVSGPGDLGCGRSAPFCVRPVGTIANVCVECVDDAGCDDANPCTRDTCGSAGRCISTALPRGTACGGGFVCTGSASSLCVECVEDAQCDAAKRCDTMLGVCVFRTDAAVERPDAAVSEPDAAVPGPDAAVSEPDAAIPGPDAAVSQPDAAVRIDAGTTQTDAAPPREDAGPIDAAQPRPDAAGGSSGGYAGGFACRTSHARPHGALALLVLLGLAIAHRRRR